MDYKFVVSSVYVCETYFMFRSKFFIWHNLIGDYHVLSIWLLIVTLSMCEVYLVISFINRYRHMAWEEWGEGGLKWNLKIVKINNISNENTHTYV